MMKTCIALVAVLAIAGCKKDEKKADDKGAAKVEKKEAEPPKEEAPPKEPEPAPAPVPAGPSASDDKEFLGLELAPVGKWKPAWDPDAKVAKWENEDYMFSIVIRVVTDKLDTIDDLKAAAPMMMQLGTAIEKVDEEQKTDKGWYAVVERDGQTELVYIQKYGASQIVCSANLTKQELGSTIEKADALAACDSIKLKP